MPRKCERLYLAIFIGTSYFSHGRLSRSSTRMAKVLILLFVLILVGSIDVGEIKHILTNLGERMTEEEVGYLDDCLLLAAISLKARSCPLLFICSLQVTEVLKEAGLDSKPSISCEDFVKIMLAAS